MANTVNKESDFGSCRCCNHGCSEGACKHLCLTCTARCNLAGTTFLLMETKTTGRGKQSTLRRSQACPHGCASPCWSLAVNSRFMPASFPLWCLLETQAVAVLTSLNTTKAKSQPQRNAPDGRVYADHERRNGYESRPT